MLKEAEAVAKWRALAGVGDELAAFALVMYGERIAAQALNRSLAERVYIQSHLLSARAEVPQFCEGAD